MSKTFQHSGFHQFVSNSETEPSTDSSSSKQEALFTVRQPGISEAGQVQSKLELKPGIRWAKLQERSREA